MRMLADVAAAMALGYWLAGGATLLALVTLRLLRLVESRFAKRPGAEPRD